MRADGHAGELVGDSVDYMSLFIRGLLAGWLLGNWVFAAARSFDRRRRASENKFNRILIDCRPPPSFLAEFILLFRMEVEDAFDKSQPELQQSQS